ncbi:MAG TPA: glycosyltransferase [Kiritimatiellia bacterium]|nr:glycosyltransferase [Kiritimatiellia bacterium]HMO98148.1 glycosyltransferase [Kiritimatiellia bacterium]
MTLQRPRPVIAGFSFAHHGRYSSFFRLMAYLEDCERYNLTPPIQRLIPKEYVRRWNYRWLKAGEWRLLPVYRRRAPQVIHYIYPENTLYRGIQWNKQHQLIATLHQPYDVLTGAEAPPWKDRLLEGLRRCQALVVLCASEVKPIRELTGVHDVSCIRHGIDTDFFRRIRPRDPAAPRLLTIGNWMRDWPTWAEAVRMIQAARPEVEVDVIAEPYSHREAQAAMGAGGRGIYYHTGLNDEQFKAFYERASALFLPLRSATANNALLESMAMALPVVLSDLSALREYTGPDAGIYFPPGDARAAAECVLRLLSDPAEQQRQGLHLRRQAETALGWPAIASQYRALYRRHQEQPAHA